MKRYIRCSEESYTPEEIIEDIKAEIAFTYHRLEAMPKPDSYNQLAQYYGSTPLYTTRGNMLELITDEPLSVYNYGSTSNYKHAWAIKVGGAYKQRATDDLMDYIRDNKQILFDAGYAIIAQYGTNYCTYGIAKR